MKIIVYAGQVGGGSFGKRNRFFHLSIKSFIFLSIISQMSNCQWLGFHVVIIYKS